MLSLPFCAPRISKPTWFPAFPNPTLIVGRYPLQYVKNEYIAAESTVNIILEI